MNTSRLKALILCLGIGFVVTTVPAWADDYTTAVMTKVVGKLVYPHMAKLREQQGVVTCAVSIGGDGSLAGATVEASSGIPSLDDAALQAVKDAAPFDPPPHGAATTVHGRVRFQLDDTGDEQ